MLFMFMLCLSHVSAYILHSVVLCYVLNYIMTQSLITLFFFCVDLVF